MNNVELEKLINKPRAFRNHKMATYIPPRQSMIFLGADIPNRREYKSNGNIIRSMHRDNNFTEFLNRKL
jgi:hypothetical protein